VNLSYGAPTSIAHVRGAMKLDSLSQQQHKETLQARDKRMNSTDPFPLTIIHESVVGIHQHQVVVLKPPAPEPRSIVPGSRLIVMVPNAQVSRQKNSGR
jgi:hypothetical protein